MLGTSDAWSMSRSLIAKMITNFDCSKLKMTKPKSCYTEYKHTSLIEKLPFTTFSINHHHK